MLAVLFFIRKHSFLRSLNFKGPEHGCLTMAARCSQAIFADLQIICDSFFLLKNQGFIPVPSQQILCSFPPRKEIEN